jgi:hypothetical protein
MPYQDGPRITGAYSFQITPRGSTTPVTIIMQSHDYKDGGVESKEFPVGTKMVKQPMQTKCGTHELESLIPAEEAEAFRNMLSSGMIVDNGVMPDWKTAKGPHYIEDVSFSDKVDDKSTMKIVISESNGGVTAAS